MVRALVDCEIPVMGHLGLTPQSVNVMGGFNVQGRKADDALRLLDDAHRLQEAGCFAMVLARFGCGREVGRPLEAKARHASGCKPDGQAEAQRFLASP